MVYKDDTAIRTLHTAIYSKSGNISDDNLSAALGDFATLSAIGGGRAFRLLPQYSLHQTDVDTVMRGLINDFVVASFQGKTILNPNGGVEHGKALHFNMHTFDKAFSGASVEFLNLGNITSNNNIVPTIESPERARINERNRRITETQTDYSGRTNWSLN